MKEKADPCRSSHPSRAPQLTAAGAVSERNPATNPIPTASAKTRFRDIPGSLGSDPGMGLNIRAAHLAICRRSVQIEHGPTSSCTPYPARSPVSEPTPVVFVVEDDSSVREALEGLIRSAGWKVEVFVSAHEFLASPRADVPSCLVLDVALPGLSGLDLQARMAEVHQDLPIVFITGHGDIPMSVRAMKAGAVEFLTKPFLEQDLLAGIAVALDRNTAARTEEAELRELRECYASLTPREREVLELVISGRLNKQAAAELGTSEITIKVHRGRVMAKMHATSLPDLVNRAARLKLRPAERA